MYEIMNELTTLTLFLKNDSYSLIVVNVKDFLIINNVKDFEKH